MDACAVARTRSSSGSRRGRTNSRAPPDLPARFLADRAVGGGRRLHDRCGDALPLCLAVPAIGRIAARNGRRTPAPQSSCLHDAARPDERRRRAAPWAGRPNARQLPAADCSRADRRARRGPRRHRLRRSHQHHAMYPMKDGARRSPAIWRRRTRFSPSKPPAGCPGAGSVASFQAHAQPSSTSAAGQQIRVVYRHGPGGWPRTWRAESSVQRDSTRQSRASSCPSCSTSTITTRQRTG